MEVLGGLINSSRGGTKHSSLTEELLTWAVQRGGKGKRLFGEIPENEKREDLGDNAHGSHVQEGWRCKERFTDPEQ